jgi:hypothetical protein
MKNHLVMDKPILVHIMLHQKLHQMLEVIRKKRSRSFARPTIRSAVPNPQLTTISKRLSQSGHSILPYNISLI